MLIRQGDVMEFDFNPSLGHEPKGRRPGLVVSSDMFQASTSMTLICPITTTRNEFPLHLELPDSIDEVYGCVCVEQVRAYDLEARNPKIIAHLSPDDDFMRDVINILKSFY